MSEGGRKERPVAFVDADNTLWDTDSVFASAQLNLLAALERVLGCTADATDRLSFVRSIDQALAERHHLGLRYPPRLLAVAVARVLRGEDVGVASRMAGIEEARSGSLDPIPADQFEQEFIQCLRQPPELLPGVREGLQRLRDGGVLILVVTEGTRGSVARTADKYGLIGFFDRIIEASKSKRLFQRVQKLGRGRVPAFMIGDQLTRDIAPAKAAGIVTIYVPSCFRPRWELEETAVRPDYRVERFDQAVDIILTADCLGDREQIAKTIGESRSEDA